MLPPPPSWGDDTLSNYISHTLDQAFATFTHKKDLYARLACIDHTLLTVCSNLINPKNELAGVLMMRAHSGYRAACQLAINTQISESFPVMRVCVEYSLYALHIDKNPHTLEIFTRRNKDAASKQAFLSEFRMKAMRSTLKNTDKTLFEIVETLYCRCIDFGAHPNPLAIGSSLRSTKTDEEQKIEVKYLHGDSLAIGHSMDTIAKIGLASLCIFRNIFPERFEILGINVSVTKLRQEL